MTKNDQKWPKNRALGLFEKIMSLVLSGFCVNQKFLWFINILRKLHTWEKSGSQVIAKNCSRSLRFQYSLIVNISIIDKYLTLIFGMYERKKETRKAWMKETRFINRFSEKKFIWGNGSFWAQKLRILITLDPLEEFF